MKKLYTLFFIFLVSFANAQNYNNEWITFPSTQQYSLQQLLRKYDAIKYIPIDTNSIKSVDTSEAFNEAYKLINTK